MVNLTPNRKVTTLKQKLLNASIKRQRSSEWFLKTKKEKAIHFISKCITYVSMCKKLPRNVATENNMHLLVSVDPDVA